MVNVVVDSLEDDDPDDVLKIYLKTKKMNLLLHFHISFCLVCSFF